MSFLVGCEATTRQVAVDHFDLLNCSCTSTFLIFARLSNKCVTPDTWLNEPWHAWQKGKVSSAVKVWVPTWRLTPSQGMANTCKQYLFKRTLRLWLLEAPFFWLTESVGFSVAICTKSEHCWVYMPGRWSALHWMFAWSQVQKCGGLTVGNKQTVAEALYLFTSAAF